jgi:RHS repeat-associated protein
MPHVAFDRRVLWQTYGYDWLGNTVDTGDDAAGFYDRSLGAISNGSSNFARGPYQVATASNKQASRTPRDGALQAAYDAAGNLTRLFIERNGPCLPSGNCGQIFAYDWDEVGRLVRARRWDVSSGSLPQLTDTLPGNPAAVTLRYRYDAADKRVIKTAAVDGGRAEHNTLYIFDSLELRRAGWSPTAARTFDYDHDEWTEVPYLIAKGIRLARAVWERTTVPTLAGERLHVYLELPDHLGSASVVLDQATGELVERSTYQAYGAADSDYRPERWRAFREDYRFTGKEEDIEVGLQYFGKRFLNPYLNRWMSPDPLGIHAPNEADSNLYAYVAGSVLKNIDPLGLDPPAWGGVSPDQYSDDFYWQIHDSAENLGAEAEDLMLVMYAESGMNAGSRIDQPNGAVGLAQFSPVGPKMGVGNERLARAMLKSAGPEAQVRLAEKMFAQGKPVQHARMDADMLHAIGAGNRAAQKLQAARASGTPLKDVFVYNGAGPNTGEPGFNDQESKFYRANSGLDSKKTPDNRVSLAELHSYHEQFRNKPGFKAFLEKYNEVTSGEHQEEVPEAPSIEEIAEMSAELDRMQAEPAE